MPVKNIFDLIPASFFLPLSNGNRRLNYELLNVLNEKMKDDIAQYPRDLVLSWIEDYLSHTNFDKRFNDDDDKDEESEKTDHDMAVSKLSYFTKCGWVSQETDKDFKTSFQMTSFAINQMKLFSDTMEEEQRPLELTSYVYSIYSALSGNDWNHAVDRMESVDRNTANLRTLLRGLNSRVRKYLSNLISNPDAEPNVILNALLVDYRNSVVLKGFTNLRSKDNPAKYKTDILNSIANLKNHMTEMENNYIAVKCNGVDSLENRKEAANFFFGVLDRVEYLFESIDEMISKIDRKNTQYVSATFSRLEYLLNEEKDLEGRINRLFKEMQANGYESEDEFNLFTSGLIDEENSLFQPRKHHTKVKCQLPLKTKQIDPKLIEDNKRRLKEQLMFSVKEIDKFVMSFLKEKPSITAKEIPINDFKELMRLFLVEVYSTSPLVHYQIKLKDDDINWQGHNINNYVMERRTSYGSSK